MTISNNNQNLTPETMEQMVIKERLRQARLSFNIAIILTIISAATTLTGLGLFFFEKIDDAKLITSGGIASQIVSVGLLKINQESNKRLDKIATEFLDED